MKGFNPLTPMAIILSGQLLLVACGGGGGGGGGGSNTNTGTQPLSGHIQIENHYPLDQAVQVPVDAAITLTFDSSLYEGSLESGQITVRTGSNPALLGTFSLDSGHQTITFTPMENMALSTDYTVLVKKLVYDTNFRTLENEESFTFRTSDSIAPTVMGNTPANASTGISPQAPFLVDFSEGMLTSSFTAANVSLRDNNGTEYPVTFSIVGSRLTVIPDVDLFGNRTYVFSVRGKSQGAKDRSGNPLAEDLIISFQTGNDTTPPVVTGSVPPANATTLAPDSHFHLTFDDSIDPWSVEPTALVLRDDANSTVPISISWTGDCKKAVLTPTSPLNPARQYTITLTSGIAGVCNNSNTYVASTTALTFDVEADNTAPTITDHLPATDAAGVAVNVTPEITFSRALYADLVDTSRIILTQGTEVIATTITLAGDHMSFLVNPTGNLEPITAYRLTITGGEHGLLSENFLPLAGDLVIDFTTSGDSSIPTATLFPVNGFSQVPITSRMVAFFSEKMMTATITSDTVQLLVTNTSAPVAGTLSIEHDGRVVRFIPTSDLGANTNFLFRVVGGAYGVKDANGNWLDDTVQSSLTTGFNSDTTPPVASITLNEISPNRNSNLNLAPFGYSIDVSGYDPTFNAVDPTSLVITATGQGSFYPTASQIFTCLEIVAQDELKCLLPPSLSCATGGVTFTATVADLSGNRSAATLIEATVDIFANSIRPLERNQVVYLDFTTDRENASGNGTADWVQDLIDYGLIASTDPLGKNAYMQDLIEDAIVAKVNELYGRNGDGTDKTGASALRFVREQPPSQIQFMHMAIGGQDPDGGFRSLGQNSTGVLGRAWFDPHNRNYADNNSVTHPGLGIFSGELFLYQGNLHQQLYPGYLTTFGTRFKLLSPHFSGTPVGTHAHDATVLDPNFSFTGGSAAERSRYLAIFNAADDLAVAIAALLAHEVGHSLGLVAPGVCPGGLCGDTSLHSSPSLFGQLMNSVVGYDGLVEEIYEFRALNMAYLREQILVK